MTTSYLIETASARICDAARDRANGLSMTAAWELTNAITTLTEARDNLIREALNMGASYTDAAKSLNISRQAARKRYPRNPARGLDHEALNHRDQPAPAGTRRSS